MSRQNLMAPPAASGAAESEGEAPRRRRRLRPDFRPDLVGRFDATPPAPPAEASGNPTAGDEHPARPLTILTCHAPHPATLKGKHAYAHRQAHGRELAQIPFYAVATGRVVDSYAEIDNVNGCMGTRCPSTDCKKITEYRIVAHAGCVGDQDCMVCHAIAAGHATAVPQLMVA